VERLELVKKSANWKNFVAGGAGGCMGALITCPLEVVKTKLQAFNGASLTATRPAVPNFIYSFKAIIAREGFKGLFRGLLPNLVGVAPSRAIYFGVYSLVKSKAATESSIVHLGSAIIAGVTVTTITSPIWLVKTRMQLQSNEPLPGQTNYKSSLDCIKRVFHEEGIMGFYKGLGASYLGISESAISFVLYEKFKAMALAQQGNADLSNTTYLIAAGTSKLIASVTTYPHEVIRTRLREQRAPGQSPKYTGIIQAFQLIAKEEGLAGLYGGMPVHLLRVVPNAAIMFWTYEFVIRQLV